MTTIDLARVAKAAETPSGDGTLVGPRDARGGWSEAVGARATTTVMIVDDQTIVREALVHMFGQTPAFRVVASAATGVEAIPLARQLCPDLALIDLNLPRMDGIEASRRILATSPETRVVILASAESEESLISALRAGARGYVLKSLPFAGLVNSLKRVMTGDVALPRDLTTRVVLQIGNESRRSPPRLAALTDRERQILGYLIKGETNRQIAVGLLISEHTVRAHMRSLLHKLGVANRAQAAAVGASILE